MYTPTPSDIAALRRDKYNDDPAADLTADSKRLEQGEPLAYVIGWIPFLGLRISLETLPLIPRPETEWWTERLIAHLEKKYGNEPFDFLDLCAGSGAIGLAVLAELPSARVSFGEIVPAHVALIRRNLEDNGLDLSRASFYTSDLFEHMPLDATFDVVASNPPYIPETRPLPRSVSEYEPHGALFAGPQGLALIERMAREFPSRIREGGESWVECDAEHAEEVRDLFAEVGARAELHTDQYGRPRLVVSYWGHE